MQCTCGAHAVLYWDNFVDLPTHTTVKCMCFQAVKGITVAHTALCPLTVSSMAFYGHHCHLHALKW